MISVDNFFVFLRLLFFCFVVAICDLVHDVETIFHISFVLTASGNLFCKMTDARETAETTNCSFTGITHISEKISRCC